MTFNFSWYFLSFKGRISRQEFWLGYAGMIIVLLLLQSPLEDLSLYYFKPPDHPWAENELLFALLLPRLVVTVIALWPLAAISVKRLHDINLSAWWLPIFWLVAIILGFIPGHRGSNRFGEDPLAWIQGNDRRD